MAVSARLPQPGIGSSLPQIQLRVCIAPSRQHGAEGETWWLEAGEQQRDQPVESAEYRLLMGYAGEVQAEASLAPDIPSTEQSLREQLGGSLDARQGYANTTQKKTTC
ncbi:hypothetical protein TURU_085167 [Turdus rufiventris]|nr:hypothetical protein TURU_085167 [Turdus rufiventris]